MVICRSRGGWCSVMLQHPSGIPIVDKGPPDVLGFPVLCSHVRADCFCPAMQCLDHRKFVAQWVVGHKVEVAVCVGGFSVYSCRDGAIWVPLEEDIQKWELAVSLQLNCKVEEDIQKWELPISLQLNCKLYAGLHPIEVVQELLHT